VRLGLVLVVLVVLALDWFWAGRRRMTLIPPRNDLVVRGKEAIE